VPTNSAEPTPPADVGSGGVRTYHSVLRKEHAAATRQRIVRAGSELLHATSVRDWGALTVRAVAERAGVNERTVYRHFHNERGLRDAVMQRLEEEAGIELAGMQLEDVARVAGRIFEHVTSYPKRPDAPLDPTLGEAKERQHRALLQSVASCAGTWSSGERSMAAAVLDVLWSVAAYERLARDWRLEAGQAIVAIEWAIGLVEQAVRDDRRPGGGGPRHPTRR
jgi:AcrR family transcriptional regulator